MGRSLRYVIVLLAALAAAPAAAFAAPGDTARYILPPGNFGGLPGPDELARSAPAVRRPDAAARQRHDSRHQPLLPAGELQADRGHARRSRPAGRGCACVYDSYGIPHVYGKTRADVAFGAGWTTARDRGLLLTVGRGPARVAVADVPGIERVLARHERPGFVAERRGRGARDEAGQADSQDLRRQGPADPADAQAYADGITAYERSIGNTSQPPATVNDVIAVTAFIGSIFGAGGGGEATNSDLLGEAAAGARQGARVQGLGRRPAGRRPGGADHHSRPLQLPGEDRRQGHRVADHRPGLDRGRRSARDAPVRPP